ncbi:hypothetical protein RFI_03410 [Reticulomyxa filosa]|uniref:Uncharacterized protein n=1 Tax=Reticulomyxa filosa TaxID=46433 RepID=X6P671_RETFI|nr:hypothetical protein RFI_03410 [Reticulomyxa filosa]|eukprot:ETO33691.1 hypothetical protein RFI_03410 [Reticulomyxa filosa]
MYIYTYTCIFCNFFFFVTASHEHTCLHAHVHVHAIEIVDWLLNETRTSRMKCVRLAQQMMNQQWIKPYNHNNNNDNNNNNNNNNNGNDKNEKMTLMFEDRGTAFYVLTKYTTDQVSKENKTRKTQKKTKLKSFDLEIRMLYALVYVLLFVALMAGSLFSSLYMSYRGLGEIERTLKPAHNVSSTHVVNVLTRFLSVPNQFLQLTVGGLYTGDLQADLTNDTNGSSDAFLLQFRRFRNAEDIFAVGVYNQNTSIMVRSKRIVPCDAVVQACHVSSFFYQ